MTNLKQSNIDNLDQMFEHTWKIILWCLYVCIFESFHVSAGIIGALGPFSFFFQSYCVLSPALTASTAS